MLDVFRENLKTGKKKKVAGYDDITRYTGIQLMQGMAESEANQRDDISHISHDKNTETFTLVTKGMAGHRKSVVRFFGVWK